MFVLSWNEREGEVTEWLASDIDIKSLKKALNRGTMAVINDAKNLDLPFLRVDEDDVIRFHPTRQTPADVNPEEMDTAELLEADDECADADDLELINSDPSEMPTEVETSLYGKIDIRSAETLLLNGGRTTFGAKERAKRFYSNPYTVSTSEMRDYHISLPCSCDSLLKKGDTVSLPLHDKKDGVRRARGEVRFICTSNRVPLNHYCQEHFTKKGTINVWLFSGNKYVRCTLS